MRYGESAAPEGGESIMKRPRCLFGLAKIAALVEKPILAPRPPNLPYNICSHTCACGEHLTGDWGLVPSECLACEHYRVLRYQTKYSDWADSRLALLQRAVVGYLEAVDWASVSSPNYGEAFAKANTALSDLRAASEAVKP